MKGRRYHLAAGFRALRHVAAWLTVGAFAAAILGTVVVPRMAGATPYVVLTSSMKPSLPPGTMVVSRPVAPASIPIGSVITYQLVSGEPAVVTHRVVGQGVTSGGDVVFRTKGDANSAADPGWVRAVQVRGSSWYAIPYIGYVTNQLQVIDRVAVQRAVAVALLGYASVLILGAVRGRRTVVTR